MDASTLAHVRAAPASESQSLRHIGRANPKSAAILQAMKEQPAKRGPTVIHKKHRRMPSPAEYDVCVCGGTLGIFVATALQVQGLLQLKTQSYLTRQCVLI